ncbi:response regulator transcription factor [Luteolibacter flavescens]|uniref:Response regulator transcription factor n=1 Tax=Luteolibacter flavescens TaxID=1859460 RepID=A0ABT3FVK7_9BACT|nr:response regulator transcription factor [Luteolibacter flavescens]MCW1887005.1 response regulator transcription factor [Luteolibacter flavescens]
MTKPCKALIIDDERLARKRLRDLLSAHPRISVVGEADGVQAAASLCAELQPDLLFLDIEMPPHNGFDLLPLLQDGPAAPDVVFVTAHESFAIRAFEVSALDYLLKPIHPDRLEITIRKLEAAPRPGIPEKFADQDAWTMTSKIALGDRSTTHLVVVASIVHIQALGAYSRVHLTDKPPMIVLRSISEWEKRLPSSGFCRVDRSLIVQSGMIRKMATKSRDETEIVMEGLQAPLTLGRAATARLKKQLKEIE